MESIFWGVIGGGSIISLVAHAYTLWRITRTPDNAELRSKVTHLNSEVADLIDRVDSWQRRDKTREARARKAEKAEEGEIRPLTHVTDKNELRRRIYGGSKGGQNVMAE